MGRDIRAESSRAAQGNMVMYAREARHGEGWIGFAAIMLGLAGLWNVLEGIAAIANSRIYVGE